MYDISEMRRCCKRPSPRLRGSLKSEPHRTGKGSWNLLLKIWIINIYTWIRLGPLCSLNFIPFVCTVVLQSLIHVVSES